MKLFRTITYAAIALAAGLAVAKAEAPTER